MCKRVHRWQVPSGRQRVDTWWEVPEKQCLPFLTMLYKDEGQDNFMVYVWYLCMESDPILEAAKGVTHASVRPATWQHSLSSLSPQTRPGNNRNRLFEWVTCITAMPAYFQGDVGLTHSPPNGHQLCVTVLYKLTHYPGPNQGYKVTGWHVCCSTCIYTKPSLLCCSKLSSTESKLNIKA